MSNSSKEVSMAASLMLKAKAMESYAMIKDLLLAPTEEGHSEKIASAAMQLVQYEGAALTLQQYFGDGVPEGEAADPHSATAQDSEADEPLVVTEERSPTYRRALEKEKIKKTAKKRSKKNEE